MNMQKKEDERINILTLGNSAVGKTSFMIRYTEDNFREVYLSSIGMDYKSKKVTLPNNKTYRIELYDTAGQEKYRAISLNLVKYAEGIILMYDITSRDSFESISGWIESIKDVKSDNFPIILVGNKCDLEDRRKVSLKEGENLANQFGMKFFETSNKDWLNIDKVCLELIKQILEQRENGIEGDYAKLKLDRNKKLKKKNCCERK